MDGARAAREVVIVAWRGVQSLDVTGPLEVFAGAARLVEASGGEARGYRVSILSKDGIALRTSSGLTVTPHGSLADAPPGIDTVILAGGPGWAQAAADRALLDWIART